MYIVYVLELEKKRFYVGMTKKYRSIERILEHLDPECRTTKWTSKYQAKRQIYESRVFENKRECELFEHQITELIMSILGLNCVRGGNYVMSCEESTWWIPKRLENTPLFTELWENSNVVENVTKLLASF